MAMEDRNMLAADCVVISCCCQCLILQIIIFFLLKLPCKLIRKTKEYAKKKLQHRRREETIIKTVEGSRYREELMLHGGGSGRIKLKKGFPFTMEGEHGLGCCMEEVEKVLEEFCRKGEFAFGSFWGREAPSRTRSSSTTTKVVEEDCNFSAVQFEFVEIVASITYS